MAGAGRRRRNGGVNVLKANTLPLACGFAVRNVVEALICAAPLRLLARRDETLDLARPRHLATFIVMALGPASLCSATLAATLFATLAHVSFQRILFQWYAPMRLGF